MLDPCTSTRSLQQSMYAHIEAWLLSILAELEEKHLRLEEAEFTGICSVKSKSLRTEASTLITLVLIQRNASRLIERSRAVASHKRFHMKTSWLTIQLADVGLSRLPSSTSQHRTGCNRLCPILVLCMAYEKITYAPLLLRIYLGFLQDWRCSVTTPFGTFELIWSVHSRRAWARISGHRCLPPFLRSGSTRPTIRIPISRTARILGNWWRAMIPTSIWASMGR